MTTNDNLLNRHIMKQFWIRRGIRFLSFGLLVIGLVGLAVMMLWNALLPAILGVTTITFGQALGLLVLSRLLFGSFGRGRPGWGRPGQNGPDKQAWKEKLAERFQHLTPEEREEMKARWRERCGPKGGYGRWQQPPSDEPAGNTTPL